MEIKFDFNKTLITIKTYEKYKTKLEEETSKLKESTLLEYKDERCSINLPFDSTILKETNSLLKKITKPKTIIVVGIGGSNLGTMAVYEALKGKRANEIQDKKIYFADTTDPDSINEINEIIKTKLKKNEKVLLNAISKSGSTTETIANFVVLKDTLKKFDKDYKNHIVITTVENSPFYSYARKEEFHILTMPENVGGRYSIFSQVGVFPLTFLGINTQNLLKGAREMRQVCLTNSVTKNYAMKSAISIYEYNQKDKNIFNTFLFSTNLESLGKWYRQLLGESIGKEKDRNNKKVNTGITPITSIGSTDLHSMAQLFLGGPNDKFHCFINIQNTKKIKIPKDKEIEKIVSDLLGKDMKEVMNAIYGGVTNAFVKKKKPFYEITIPKIDEYNIGALLQMKMIEMMYLGALFNVNPFNQPNVEEYKIITKELLKNK